MELLLFRPKEFEVMYNCSLLRIDDVPLEHRIDLLNGFVQLFLFVLCEILYIPCMFSIWHRMDNSCYKLLFYVGITDMVILWIVAFSNGYFALTGAVFCSNPTLIYVLGTFSMGLWAAESIAELALAIDRCLEMSYPETAQLLFHGNRVWIWIAFGTAYALYWIMFAMPVLFSAIYGSWFFNPYVGYDVDRTIVETYHNYWHSAHNTFMALAFPAIYLILGIKLALASRHTSGNVQRSVNQKMMFVQVAIISGFNFYTCLLYVSMQYFTVSEAHILLAHYGWLCIHGMPPFIFLIINTTIRNDCRKMIASGLFRVANGLQAPSSVAVPSVANGNYGTTRAQVHPGTNQQERRRAQTVGN